MSGYTNINTKKGNWNSTRNCSCYISHMTLWQLRANRHRFAETISRFCKYGEPETIMHALMDCPIYSAQKASLLRKMWLIFLISHILISPPLKSGRLKKWLWKVWSVLNRTGKIIIKFSDFYFSSYHRKLGWWRHKNDTQMTIIRKIKIGKI